VTERTALRAQCATAGTVMAARLALEHGVACNTAGGSHHASRMQGAGFCTFNDVAWRRMCCSPTARYRTRWCSISTSTRATARRRSSPMTTASSPPRCTTEGTTRMSRQTSDYDLGLPDGMEDLAYLKTLALVLEELRDRITPDIVFYNAGVDVHRDDRLGRLSLTDHGIEQRERMVFSHFRQRGIPVCGVIGGGYSKDIEAIALRHVILHRVASEFVF
jgi:acetoin utilization deacetylase AcuC-like enzyme